MCKKERTAVFQPHETSCCYLIHLTAVPEQPPPHQSLPDCSCRVFREEPVVSGVNLLAWI
jgi:hypothetical protein